MSSAGTQERARGEVTHRRRPRLLIELLVIVVGYMGYSATRVAARGETNIADDNAHHLINLERTLHLDPEHWLNSILNAHAFSAQVAGYYYASMHFAITPLVLIWLYWRYPYHYRWARTSLAITTLSSLLVFWWFPVAPPRFAEAHITDTLAVYKILELAAPRGGTSTVANLNAAMPSLHVGWAAWCAFAVWIVFHQRHKYLAAAAWLYPLTTYIVVLGTGNHYLIDGIGGLVALSGGIGVATLIMRWREVQAWVHDRMTQRTAHSMRPGPEETPNPPTIQNPVTMPDPAAIQSPATMQDPVRAQDQVETERPTSSSKAAGSKVSVFSEPSSNSPSGVGASNDSPAVRPAPSSER